MPPTLLLRIIALATLLTVAFSSGCVPDDMQQAMKKARKKNPDAERTEPITLTCGFCSMEVPPNWSKSDQGRRGGGGIIVHSVPVPEEGLSAKVHVSVSEHKLENTKSLQQLQADRRTLESESKFKVGGRDATKLITLKEGMKRKNDRRYVTVWVPLDATSICFEAQGSPKEIDAAMSDIEFMLQSMKIQKHGFFSK